MAEISIKPLNQSESQEAVDLLVECFGEDMRDPAKVDVSATFMDYPYVPLSFVAKHGEHVVGFVKP